MIVRCRATTPPASQAGRLRGYGRQQRERLELEHDYVVIGLQLETDSLIWGSGVWVQLADGDGLLIVPLCLFDVIDSRLPRRWEVRRWEDESVTMWPPAFYAEYFHDDLAAAKAPAVEAFRRVRDALEIEARTSTNPGPSR